MIKNNLECFLTRCFVIVTAVDWGIEVGGGKGQGQSQASVVLLRSIENIQNPSGWVKLTLHRNQPHESRGRVCASGAGYGTGRMDVLSHSVMHLDPDRRQFLPQQLYLLGSKLFVRQPILSSTHASIAHQPPQSSTHLVVYSCIHSSSTTRIIHLVCRFVVCSPSGFPHTHSDLFYWSQYSAASLLINQNWLID